MPWPANAASPWSSTGKGALPRLGPVSRHALLLGPHDALDDRVDRLEVRRVRLDLDRHVAARLGAARGARALVVLHVALVGREVRMHDALEAAEDALGGVADDVGEDVQPAAVRHADDDLVHAARRRALDQAVEQRDRRVDALDGVAPLAQELRPEEALELFGRDELGEQDLAHAPGQRLRVRGRGDALPDPVLFGGARDVAVLGADLAAVDAAHDRDDLAQRQHGRRP